MDGLQIAIDTGTDFDRLRGLKPAGILLPLHHIAAARLTHGHLRRRWWRRGLRLLCTGYHEEHQTTQGIAGYPVQQALSLCQLKSHLVLRFSVCSLSLWERILAEVKILWRFF